MSDAARQKTPPHSPATPVPAYPRIVNLNRRPQIEVIGRRKSGLDDLYHNLLTVSWPMFVALSVGAYFALNCLFAVMFWLDPDGVSGMASRSFPDAFFFSVQTFGTIGYGAMAPRDLYTNLMVTAESFVGLFAVAAATGIIFARVSRPTARVMFSKRAVITTHDGERTLIFRCANERANQILDAEVTLSVAKQVTTDEGLTLRRMLDLKVTRSRSPLFALTWMVMHPIDERSPLFGATPESLLRDKVELIVVLAGVDETFAQRIHARHSYMPNEIAWDRQFADVLSVRDDGRRVIDYSKFHLLEDELADNGAD